MENQPEQKKKLEEARIVVNYDDPPRKSAPRSSVGPVGWVRKNLFGSPADTILTILSVVILVAIIVNITQWSVQQANWLAVNQNFRNFMAGTFPLESIWRLNALVYLSAFMTGFTIATWSRAGRDSLVMIGIGLAIMFALPLIAQTAIPKPSTFLSAGLVDVQSGTVTESPYERVAFAARSGEVVTINVPGDFTSDAAVVALAGFTDRPMKAYWNAAQNRQVSLDRLDQIERELAAHARVGGGLLSCSQFIDLKQELLDVRDDLESYALNEEAVGFEVEDETILSCEDTLDLPETDYREVTDVYSVNSADVTVVLTDEAGEVLAEQTLSAGSGELTATLPADGWYIIETDVAEEGVLVTLETTTAYPLIERAVVETAVNENGEPQTDPDSDRVLTETVSEFVNIYSRFITRQERPTLTVDGESQEVDILRLTDAKYTGERPVTDYLTLGLAPLFDRMNMMSLFFVVFMMAGYGSATGIKQVAPKVPGGGITPKIALGGWGLYTYMLFLLSIGIVSLSGVGMGNVIAMIVWVGIMFFIGMNYPGLPRSIGQGLLGTGLVMILGHVLYYRAQINAVSLEPQPFLDFSSGIGGWAVSAAFIVQLALWIIIGITSFNMGVGAENSLGQSSKRRGLVGAFITWAAILFLTPFVINSLIGANVMSSYRADNLLPIADMSLWGGLLLTFMLTAVGIVASFPIGVLLALGRRAHRYPAIKYICILYIEFVRGVPLVSVLFMASLLVPLVNPALATVPGVIRAMVGITMFSAAYLAENVRGGLQSIPDGQEEAGKALGLNNVQITMQIMLPQALRAVIPALVGQAISLFKDTSLVYIVGLADLTRVAIRVVAQSEFVGHRLETLMFISVIYFIFSYIMSFVSRRIEESGSGSARK